MATLTICIVCNRTRNTYLCDGCSKHFCLDHLPEHQRNLSQQLHQIENNHDELRQNLNQEKTNPTKPSLIKEIDQWEKDSIEKIKQKAQQCREKLINYTKEYLRKIEEKLNHLAEQMKEMRQENEFNQIDLKHLKERLQKLQEKFLLPPNFSVQRQSTLFIDHISILTRCDTQWKQLGIKIAGGYKQGKRSDQLSRPFNICIDNDQAIYIADHDNARIVEWTPNAEDGRIVAGKNGPGKQTDQLYHPRDLIIDRENNSLIIADRGNRRVMRWSRQTKSHGEIIIGDIDCYGLTMHKDGSLYVSDCKKNEVKRWRRGETNGTVVAGGNGKGNQLNQLDHPTYLSVDDDHTLYVSDRHNHRVMKWMRDDREGIVVAGGNGKGDRLTQLSSPSGVIIDQFGQIYVADCGNARVMRWYEGEKEGTVVVGGNGRGEQVYQLSGPMGLSFDGEENLYVADCENHRIQKFVID